MDILSLGWEFILTVAALIVGFIGGVLIMCLLFLSKKFNSLIPDMPSSKTLSGKKRVQ